MGLGMRASGTGSGSITWRVMKRVDKDNRSHVLAAVAIVVAVLIASSATASLPLPPQSRVISRPALC